MTSPVPMRTFASVTTWTLPSRTRPAAGAAFAVTVPGTVHEPPAGRTAFASVTATEPNAGFANTSTYLYVVVPAGTAKPSTSTTQTPAAGLAIVTDSSESPSADWPASTQVPVVQLKTKRSRSAAGSDVLPIVARSDVEPGVTCTWNCCCSRFAIVGVCSFALPSAVPTALPVKGPNRFVSVYERAIGVPRVAEAIVSGSGDTVAPRMDAFSVNGAAAVSDVRRASTTTSHTPACGSDTVLLVGLPASQPAASGGL